MASFNGTASGPGAWPDPDLVTSYGAVGADGAAKCEGAGKLEYCTGSFCDPVQSHAVAQFGLWAVMGAPLLLSFDLTNLDAKQKALYGNPEIVRVNQDKDPATGRGTAGGRRVFGGDFDGNSTQNIWARSLHDGGTTMIFVNNGVPAAKMVCDGACVAEAGLVAGRKYAVRDLHARKDLVPITLGAAGVDAGQVDGDAGSVLLKLSPLAATTTASGGRGGMVAIDWAATPAALALAIPTYLDQVNPSMDRASPMHDVAFRRMDKLGAKLVRYLHWSSSQAPFAELQEGVFNFSKMDEYVLDFMACENAPGSVMNFDAGPCWLHQGADCARLLRDPTGVVRRQH